MSRSYFTNNACTNPASFNPTPRCNAMTATTKAAATTDASGGSLLQTISALLDQLAQLQSLLGPKRRQPRTRLARAADDAVPSTGKTSATPAAAARKPPTSRPDPPSAGTDESTWAEIVRLSGPAPATLAANM